MKTTSTLSIFLLSILLIFSCQNRENTGQLENKFYKYMPLKKGDKSYIMAHRGRLSDEFAENAIESFEAVYSLSKDIIIEFDVRQTKDGILVLMHDETLDRTTTGNGRISEKMFDELIGLNLITNRGDTTSLSIPTYEVALKWANDKNFLAIDAKPGINLELIVKGIEQNGLLDRAMIICYSIKDAEHYLNLNSNLILAIGFNTTEKIKAIKHSSLPKENLVALTPTSVQKESFYDQIHEMNIPVAFGTYKSLDLKDLNSVKDLYIQQSQNFEILTTDRTGEVFKLLNY